MSDRVDETYGHELMHDLVQGRTKLSAHLSWTLLLLIALSGMSNTSAYAQNPDSEQISGPSMPSGVDAQTASQGDLARRADWQARIVSPGENPWAEVREVEAGSPAARAGLRAWDRITHVNGTRTDMPSIFDDARRATRGSTPVELVIERDGGTREIRFTPRPLPLESDPALDIAYGSVVTAPGYRLRTIVTQPKGTQGKLPSLFLVPWLSCASVEVFNKQAAGMDRLLAGVIRQSGFLTLRVEKPGVGDSEGPGSSKTDLKTEMGGLLQGLAQLKAHPQFDPERLFFMGMSLGGGLAPLVAEGENPRGIVSVVGLVKTWFEHMMEFERRRLTLSGKTPAEINDAMSGYAELYTEYLIRGKTPAEVIAERPALKTLWYDEPAHQYGRPAVFYSQLQTLNLEGAWQKVNVPTLIVAGEYDWTMSEDDHDIIAELVNRNSPGAATLVRWPRASHELEQFPSRQAAFDEEGGTFDDALIELVVKWLHEHAS